MPAPCQPPPTLLRVSPAPQPAQPPPAAQPPSNRASHPAASTARPIQPPTEQTQPPHQPPVSPPWALAVCRGCGKHDTLLYWLPQSHQSPRGPQRPQPTPEGRAGVSVVTLRIVIIPTRCVAKRLRQA